MRTPLDRLRHALLFELFAVLIAAPVVHWVTGRPLTSIGGLAVVLSLLAVGWNYIYNQAFDRWELVQGWPRPRGLATRFLHALGFELVLLIVGVAIIAWWLRMSLLQAFLLDAGFLLFFVFYALAFNWSYDRLFPLSPATKAVGLIERRDAPGERQRNA